MIPPQLLIPNSFKLGNSEILDHKNLHFILFMFITQVYIKQQNILILLNLMCANMTKIQCLFNTTKCKLTTDKTRRDND